MNSCVACTRPDEVEDMVACDMCEEWQHYSCAGVDEKVKHKPWMCAKCRSAAKDASGTTAKVVLKDHVERAGGSCAGEQVCAGDTRSTRSSVKERPHDDYKRMIKDEKWPVRSGVVERLDDGDARTVRSNVVKEMRDRDTRSVRSSVVEEMRDRDTRSVRSSVVVEKRDRDTRSVRSSALVEKQVRDTRSVRSSAVEEGRCRDTRPVHNSVVEEWRDRDATSRPRRDNAEERRRADDTSSTRSGVKEQWEEDEKKSVGSGAMRRRREYETRSICRNAKERESDDDEEEELQEQLLSNEIALLRLQLSKRLRAEKESQERKLNEQRTNKKIVRVSGNESVTSMTTEDKVEDWLRTAEEKGHSSVRKVCEEGPSKKQIAARHIIGKDLPYFSGDPKQWAMWFSNYERTTVTCGLSADENLIRLQRCLKGPALELVQGRLLLPENVPSAIELLRKRYGQPITLLKALIEKVRSTPPPKVENMESIVKFGSVVDELVQHIVVAKMDKHLNNPTLLDELVLKLPPAYQLQWIEYGKRREEEDISVFSQFTNGLMDSALELVAKHSKPERLSNNRGHVNFHNSAVQQKYVKKCAICTGGGHGVATCATFKKLSVQERLKQVDKFGLCKICLNIHGKQPCKKTDRCEIADCRLHHHTLLHLVDPTTTLSNTLLPAKENQGFCASHSRVGSTSVSLFRIIPVTLQNEDQVVTVFAFLDEGSDLTLLDEDVAKQLNVSGQQAELNMTWTGHVSRTEKQSLRVDKLAIYGPLNKKYYVKDVRTVKQLQLPEQSLCYSDLVSKFSHLSGLPITDYKQVTPKMLIGMDNLNLIVPVKVREGAWKDPIAVKCKLGWGIYGRSQSNMGTGMVGYHKDNSSEETITTLVRKYIVQDNMNINDSTKLMESEEDKKARITLQNTTRRVGKGFETGLLWRYDNPTFPPSYEMALKRFRALERRLSKNANLYTRVRSLLREYEEKGYTHRATVDELQGTQIGKCWYLPLGVVINPKKPTKVRLIWDAAATVQGISLNSALLKGPDLLKSLIAVLYNFRKYAYALTGDIREMFHRVQIRPADRQFQRFLWRENNTCDIQVYIMDVAIFGAACSPTSAQYIKNLNATEVGKTSERAVRAILNYHYVDDYLDSFPTIEEAIEVGKEVKRIHAEGAFEIRNFLSNHPIIVEGVSNQPVQTEKTIYVDKQLESVLGMKWKLEDDILTFIFKMSPELEAMLEETHIPTKREVLRIIMSLFDPLGLLSFFIIQGRILLQDIWISGTDWDIPINKDLHEHWKRWVDMLPRLPDVKIPRCYFQGGNYATYNETEVHIFVDASKSAYAAAAYFRVRNHDELAVTLVAAKAKVAPLKLMSIPRLELQGAVLGVRLLNNVIENHQLPVTRRVLWTDSEIVLAWLRADHRKYQQFVGFRVAEILGSTDICEWRKVDTCLNVADLATKWGKGPCFDENSPWFQGPSFLTREEEYWPTQKEVAYTTSNELRAVHVHTIQSPIIETERFSSWDRLLRTIAYIHFFVAIVRKEDKELPFGQLKQEHYAKAENTLCLWAQQEYYAQEIKQLRNLQSISKSSSLYKLAPFLDEKGIMRMKGRIEASDHIAYETKHPIILPQRSRITLLLANKFHRRFRHGNRETIVNEIRQQYHIPKLRVLIARVNRECMMCRIRHAKSRTPPMAPLPVQRVTPFVRPFTYVGVDYFGPLYVKVGRSNAKRWIALFTCLSIRAIHMEVVHSLSTESCVMAVRRFVARRGAPAEIFSDNGTNFQGANKQLNQEKQQRYRELSSTFTNANTRWIFNPPGAPHMGGVWERMVRSVKVAIGEIIESHRKPNDEALETIILEAESMINSRPLTYIPLESADQEALTPNHFLLGSSSGVKQPEVHPTDYRATLRSSWKLAQYLLDSFWRRWTKEYLPILSRQSKWFETVKPLETGDLVFIIDGTTRNAWRRGKIERVVKGRDGRVRQAWVNTNSGLIRRPAIKLALIDIRVS